MGWAMGTFSGSGGGAAEGWTLPGIRVAGPDPWQGGAAMPFHRLRDDTAVSPGSETPVLRSEGLDTGVSLFARGCRHYRPVVATY